MTNEGTVNTIPFKIGVGYPQFTRVVIGGVAYGFNFYYNMVGAFVVLTVTRGEVTLFTGKLTPNQVVTVRHVNGVLVFALLIRTCDDKQTEMWVFEDV